jgi:integrase
MDKVVAIFFTSKANFMSKRTFSSINARYFIEFIDFKRGLGYKYETEEITLLTFDRFLLTHNYACTCLSKEIIDQWTDKRINESDITRYGRMICLIQFLSYLRDCGVKTPIPLLPKYPKSTFIPYIYSHEEIAAIFEACDLIVLGDRDMYSCLFIMPCLLRVLYSTGIRIGEALSMDNRDIDLHKKCLTLRATKNTKDRFIPFGDSLAAVFVDYLQHRDALPCMNTNDPQKPFFITLIGTRCKEGNVAHWFRKVLMKAKIPLNSSGKGPRIHDIRHCFACHSFVQLANDGMDLYCSWPYLSTYLGHQSLRATEQYIRLCEQLYPEMLKGTDSLYVEIIPDFYNTQIEIS